VRNETAGTLAICVACAWKRNLPRRLDKDPSAQNGRFLWQVRPPRSGRNGAQRILVESMPVVIFQAASILQVGARSSFNSGRPDPWNSERSRRYISHKEWLFTRNESNNRTRAHRPAFGNIACKQSHARKQNRLRAEPGGIGGANPLCKAGH